MAAALLASLLAAVPASAAPKTVWLCKPGKKADPCDPGLRTTVYSPAGKKLRVKSPRADRPRQIDCFYVYPTVSDQKSTLANLRIDPEERSIALFQAARYSQHCRVFAPMYRQVTLQGLGDPTKVTDADRALGYTDVRAAWRTYLKKYNRGRGVVLIGHSQGTRVLRQLVTEEIDPKPAARRRLVSALLMGGNVLVKKGRDVGRRLQAREGLPRGHAGGLRGGLLDVRRTRSGRLALRPPARGPAGHGGAVRESGGARRRRRQGRSHHSERALRSRHHDRSRHRPPRHEESQAARPPGWNRRGRIEPPAHPPRTPTSCRSGRSGERRSSARHPPPRGACTWPTRTSRSETWWISCAARRSRSWVACASAG